MFRNNNYFRSVLISQLKRGCKLFEYHEADTEIVCKEHEESPKAIYTSSGNSTHKKVLECLIFFTLSLPRYDKRELNSNLT